MQEWVTPGVLEQVAQICRYAGALIMPYFEAEGMDFDNKADARKSRPDPRWKTGARRCLFACQQPPLCWLYLD